MPKKIAASDVGGVGLQKQRHSWSTVYL